jgi:protein PET100
MYILFPIGIMYYFGTNLDRRFSVPDFWPKPEQLHKIPTEKEEIKGELDRLRARRLELRRRRLEEEGVQVGGDIGGMVEAPIQLQGGESGAIQDRLRGRLREG